MTAFPTVQPLTEQHIGQEVSVQGYGTGMLSIDRAFHGPTRTALGVLRYFGPHATKAGLRCGVELESSVGNNNGTVQVGRHPWLLTSSQT